MSSSGYTYSGLTSGATYPVSIDFGYTTLHDAPEYKKLIKMGYNPVFVYKSNFGKFIDKHFPKLSNILKIKKLKVEHILKRGKIKVICNYFGVSFSCVEHDGYYTFNTSISNLNRVLKKIIQLEREDKLKRLLKNNI